MRLATHELSQVGRMVAKRYREKYGKDPETHQGLANGKCVPINTYFEKDRDLIVDALHVYKDVM